LVLLEPQILDTVRYYSKLTVRQLYYILVSKFGYTPSRSFYKRLDYHLVKLRRRDPRLNDKFTDPTRHFLDAVLPYTGIELWMEKDSIRNLLQGLAWKYRVAVQVLRGFASLSMYHKALSRAKKRGVKRILYVGDFDSSGLAISKVAEREMRIKFQRVVLTKDQIRRFRLPSIPVNMRDSRAEAYVSLHGDRCWEAESLRPRTFLKLVEDKLREHVPRDFLEKANVREKASRIAKPLAEKFRAILEREVFNMLQQGKSNQEIQTHLQSKYGSRIKVC